MDKNALIIFVKNPVEGKVKTRLAKTIGNEHAVNIYKKLLQHTHTVTIKLSCDKYVYYGDYINTDDIWNVGYNKCLQAGGDLGSRMKQAFEEIFSKGYSKVLIIGSDCAQLEQAIIENAFNMLDDVDIVIGPSLDGGYYLLGMNKLHADLFKNIEWSTGDVYSATVKTAQKSRLSITTTKKLSDVDVIDDVPKNWL